MWMVDYLSCWHSYCPTLSLEVVTYKANNLFFFVTYLAHIDLRNSDSAIFTHPFDRLRIGEMIACLYPARVEHASWVPFKILAVHIVRFA